MKSVHSPLPFALPAHVIVRCGLACLDYARLELLDATTIGAFNAFAKDVPDLPVQPHLFLEFHGLSERSVQEQVH
jgi:hypothetical protein